MKTSAFNCTNPLLKFHPRFFTINLSTKRKKPRKPGMVPGCKIWNVCPLGGILCTCRRWRSRNSRMGYEQKGNPD